MKTIFEKELLQYFHSVIGYIFLAISVLISGYYFLVSNLLVRSGDISDYFRSTVQIMIFLMPLLTMRSFSEEKRQKTDILLSIRVRRSADIVLGKFLAALVMYLIGTLLTLAFPAILSAYGSTQRALTVGGYLGMILLMADFIAIGLFVSSLTDNQIVAAAGTYMILFLAWYSYGFGSNLQNQKLLTVLNRLSLMNRYNELIMGVLNPAGIAVMLSVMAAFLFLTCVVTQRLAKPRPVTVVLVLALLISANLFVTALTKRFDLSGDLTQGQLFHLSDVTREVLDGLDRPVAITYFDKEKGSDTNISQLLKRYAKSGKNIELKYLDLQANPGMVTDYANRGITLSDNGVLVEAGDNACAISWSEMYGYNSYTGSDGKIHYTLTSFKAEPMITSAIARVCKDEEKSVLFTQGHGESIGNALLSLAENGGYRADAHVPALDGISEEYTAVVIAGARRDFSADEIAAIDEYMKTGGRLLVFRDPSAGELPALDGYLSEWGLEADAAIVIEPSRQMDSPVNIIPDFAVHMMNVYFSEHVQYLVLPVCAGLTLRNVDGRLTAPVLRSTSSAYEKNAGEVSGLEQEDEDPTGPFVLAATSEESLTLGDGTKESAVVFLIGSSRFCEDSMLENPSYGNGQLILQALAYPENDRMLPGIPEKSLSNTTIAIPWSATLSIGILFIGVLPAVFILAGLIVWIRRRRA